MVAQELSRCAQDLAKADGRARSSGGLDLDLRRAEQVAHDSRVFVEAMTDSKCPSETAPFLVIRGSSQRLPEHGERFQLGGLLAGGGQAAQRDRCSLDGELVPTLPRRGQVARRGLEARHPLE